MRINRKYSYKIFDGLDLTKEDPNDFNDSEIIGASFFQETPFTKIFPLEISNVVFTQCNLDNCIIPVGCIVNGGTNKQFAIQNDGEEWIVNEDFSPIEPLHKDTFIRLGLSINPKDIPRTKLDGSLTVITEMNNNRVNQE